MNTFTNYLEKFGSNFLVAAMVPSLGLVIACMVVFDPILHISESFQIEDGIYSLFGASLLVAVPTVIIGFTLTALNTYILKVFEGYVFFRHFPFMQKAYARKARKLIDKYEDLREKIEKAEKKKRKSVADKQQLEDLRTAYYNAVAEYDQHYPPPGDEFDASFMPTKFGNILKASEAYSGTRYGMDAVQFWPRLWRVIPPDYRQYIDEARNELSFLVNLSALSVLFYILCILAILYNAPVPGLTDWNSMLENSLRYIFAAVLALFSNLFFYRAAIFSVGDFGSMIRSSYDLFRLDLLEQFRIKLPKDSVEEFQVWQNLGELIVLGQESMEFKPLKYDLKRGSKAQQLKR